MPNLYVALMHYPVVNKNGDIIASALTNLDLHDISRASKTYGVRSFYVVTPLTDQKELAERIVSHWKSGSGSIYNPKRREALELICVKDSLKEVVEDIRNQCDDSPKTVATCAKHRSGALRFGRFQEMLKEGKPYLLIFGTAWGLAEDFIAEVDYVLEPVKGKESYNHLSVRSASAIILDRLMGESGKG